MPQLPVSEAWMHKLDLLYSRMVERLSTALGGRMGVVVAEAATVARATVLSFRGEKISLRASALTYISILSLVPLLAVGFAIVRAMGQESLRRSVHEFVFTNLAPGTREQIGAYLDEFISRASAGAMGGLGGLFLLISAVSLLHNIESSLNEIWGVRRPRPLLQRVLIYWCVLTLGPIALGTSLAAGATMRAMVERSIHVPHGVYTLIPLATTVAAFTFLYVAAPNARVRLRPAFGAALLGGVALELAKYGYTLYAARSIRYSAIYGSLGAIPLFLLWVYVSWLVFLSGARLAFALQRAAGGLPLEPRLEDARDREVLFARVATVAAGRFLSGDEPPTARRIAKEIGVDALHVREALRGLREAGLVAETAGGGFVPAKPPERVTLVELARAAEGRLCGPVRPPLARDRATRSLSELFAAADRKGLEVLSGTTLASLAAPAAGPVAARPAAAAENGK